MSVELSGYWNDVDLEQIAIWDPDVIIVPPYGGATVETITESPEWQILNAVQSGHVYQMPNWSFPGIHLPPIQYWELFGWQSY